MNKNKMAIKKLIVISSVFLGLYGCGEKELTRMEELEIEQSKQDQLEDAQIEQITENSEHSSNKISDNSNQDDLVFVDENNILNGYWLVVDMEGEKNTVKLDHNDKLASVELLRINNSEGELSNIEASFTNKEELADFIIKVREQDTEVTEGIGQMFESHWDYEYSKKVEFAFKPINEQIGMLRILTTYGNISTHTYIVERIPKSEYEHYKGYQLDMSVEREQLRARAEKLKEKYSNNVEVFFGSQSYGDKSFDNQSWLLMNGSSFGEYGRGGELEFTDQQQKEFKGKDNGKVFPQYLSSDFDELYYSFATMQDNFTMSKSEKYGMIILSSKTGLMDAILIGEQEGALEAKNSVINLLLKKTVNKEGIIIKVTDSSDNIYLGISNGRIIFNLE